MLESNQVQPVISSVVTPVALEGFKTPLLNEYPGAAAAYSLRRLKSWDGKRVVRVRRASDNSEKDFSAAEVSSGTLTGWVNSQIVPPLDIRELDSNGERTGALVEAAAAYSLRNLSSSYTGNVVDVRRSSDDAVQSFTASEVADGTLEDWVNADVDKLDLGAKAAVGGLSGNYTSGTDSADFSVSNEGSTGYGYLLDNSDVGAGSYEITFDVVLNSGSLSGIIIVINDPTNYQYQNIVSGSNSFSGTIDNTGSIFFRTSGTSVADVSITNITLTQTTADGFVRTWYDQSGSDNHAVQTTAASQPKIVDAGTLVTDRDGKVALNGKGAKLALPTNAPMLSTDGTYSLFAVVDFDDQRNGNDNFNNIFRFESTTAGGAASARKPLVYLDQTTGSLFATSPSFNSGSVDYTLAETLSVQLFTNIANPALSTGNNTLYADGALVGSANNATSVNTNNLLSSNSQIFDNQETTVTHFLSELIYYPSDQSDNRTAIENNIGEVYSIAGIPAYDDTVDGFVSTWYDQSGNANDAVQATTTSQPKIVDGGVLVTGGLDFDGVDDGLFTSSNLTDTIQSATIFALTQDGVTSGTASMVRIRPNGAPGTFDGFSWEKITNDTYGPNTLIEGANASVSAAAEGQGTRNTSKNLNTLIYQQSQILAYENGALDATLNTLRSGSTPIGDVTLVDQLWLGQNFDDNARPFNGTMSEVIIYFTDQSANRAAIETNINNQYDIY